MNKIMDGVTILNTILPDGLDTIGAIIIFVSIIVLLFSTTFLADLSSNKNNMSQEYKLSTIITIISLISALVGIVLFVSSNHTTTYEVTVSENVSLTDFTSKYEIIEQRGEIYIVKERDNT